MASMISTFSRKITGAAPGRWCSASTTTCVGSCGRNRSRSSLAGKERTLFIRDSAVWCFLLRRVQMLIRDFTTILTLAAFLGTPQVLARDSSKNTYTPPPPKPYTPPPPKYNAPANSSTRSYGQSQRSNYNAVQPTPRVTTTPRNPQPGRTPNNLSRPNNNNNRAQQIANQNNRNRQIASTNLKQQQQKQLQQKQLQQKQLQQKQLQQKQLFMQKQQQAKLSEQKQADAKARLAKLRASSSNGNNANSSISTSVAHQVEKTDKPVPELKPKGAEFNPKQLRCRVLSGIKWRRY